MNNNSPQQCKGFGIPKKGRGPDKKPRKRGAEHGNYIHGQGVNREKDSVKSNNWRSEVMKKYNFKCFLTHQTEDEAGSLVCHHLYGWANYPHLHYDIDNGVLLARDVHLKFHKLYGNVDITREKFEQFARDEYGITTFPWQQGNHEPSITTEPVLDRIATIQQPRIETLKAIAASRNHEVRACEDGTNSQFATIYCKTHAAEYTVNIGNYKKAKWGLPCCSGAGQAFGAIKGNKSRKKKNGEKE